MDRATALLTILEKDNEMLSIKADIRKRTHEAMDKQQREYFLQQEIETIKQDLGDTGAETIRELRERAKKKVWPEAIETTFEKELQRLERMTTHAPDYPVQLNYLENLLELPWSVYSEDNFDLKHAQEILNRDHYESSKRKRERKTPGEIADFVSLRPSGSRQDESRKEHCGGARKEVRAGVIGRSARRGGDPRSPADVYRCPTRPNHRWNQEMRDVESCVCTR